MATDSTIKPPSMAAAAAGMTASPTSTQSTSSVGSNGTAVAAASFLNTIGVVDHFALGTGSAASDLAAMQYLGVRTSLESPPADPNDPYLVSLVNAGIRPTITIPASDGGSGGLTTAGLQKYVSEISAFAAAHPGSIAAINGFNEINNWHVNYNGMTQGTDVWGSSPSGSYQSPAAAMTDLYKMVKADPNLANVPVLDMTAANSGVDSAQLGLDTNVGHADVPSIHPYTPPGSAPSSVLQSELAGEYPKVAAGSKIAVTEFGYSTDSSGQSANGTVTEGQKGAANLNSLLTYFKSGSIQSDIYVLTDETSWPGYGLIASDTTTPNLSGTYLHNLTTILGDSGTGSFTPGSLNYSVSGLPSSASSLLLEKSNGAFDIAVWDDIPATSAGSNASVTVSFGSPVGDVKVFDPTTGTNGTDLGAANSASFTLGDHPMIVEVSGGAAPTASAASTSSSPIVQAVSNTPAATLTTADAAAAADSALSQLNGTPSTNGGSGSTPSSSSGTPTATPTQSTGTSTGSTAPLTTSASGSATMPISTNPSKIQAGSNGETPIKGEYVLNVVGNGTWTVPAGFDASKDEIDVIAGGGGGGNGTSVTSGGGGAFSQVTNVALTPGQTVNFSVGAGGAGGALTANDSLGNNGYSGGQDGGPTWFGGTSYATSTVGAMGGHGGPSDTSSPTPGGDAAQGIGQVKFSGGTAQWTYTDHEGSVSGGGGAGGPGGPGGDSGHNVPGKTDAQPVGASGGGAGSGQGNGEDGNINNANGTKGGGPGGGAGGAAGTGNGQDGTGGGGGGGAGGHTATSNDYAVGGAGGNGAEWIVAGAGGGAGGDTGSWSSAAPPKGANGGLYGGGGANGLYAGTYGPNGPTSGGYGGPGGDGGQGVIVIRDASALNGAPQAIATSASQSGNAGGASGAVNLTTTPGTSNGTSSLANTINLADPTTLADLNNSIANGTPTSGSGTIAGTTGNKPVSQVVDLQTQDTLDQVAKTIPANNMAISAAPVTPGAAAISGTGTTSGTVPVTPTASATVSPGSTAPSKVSGTPTAPSTNSSSLSAELQQDLLGAITALQHGDTPTALTDIVKVLVAELSDSMSANPTIVPPATYSGYSWRPDHQTTFGYNWDTSQSQPASGTSTAAGTHAKSGGTQVASLDPTSGVASTAGNNVNSSHTLLTGGQGITALGANVPMRSGTTVVSPDGTVSGTGSTSSVTPAGTVGTPGTLTISENGAISDKPNVATGSADSTSKQSTGTPSGVVPAGTVGTPGTTTISENGTISNKPNVATSTTGVPATPTSAGVVPAGTVGTPGTTTIFENGTVSNQPNIATSTTGAVSTGSVGGVPHWDHVVVVVEENHPPDATLNAGSFMQSLVKAGGVMTGATAEGHPSQPNYIAMMTGDTQGVSDNNPVTVQGPSLADALKTAGKSFAWYDEDPSNVPHSPLQSVSGEAGFESPFNAAALANPASLPNVSFIAPSDANNMDLGTPSQADAWLQQNLSSYLTYAENPANNAALIVVGDEDDGSSNNAIPLVVVGAGVTPGSTSSQSVSHSNLGATLLASQGVDPSTGPRAIGTSTPFSGIFSSNGATGTNLAAMTSNPATVQAGLTPASAIGPVSGVSSGSGSGSSSGSGQTASTTNGGSASLAAVQQQINPTGGVPATA